MALTEDNDVSELINEWDYFGYPVDAGLGAFVILKVKSYTKSLIGTFTNHFLMEIYTMIFLPLSLKRMLPTQMIQVTLGIG